MEKIVDFAALRQVLTAKVISQVYLPLVNLWREQGIRWQKVYPILFLSGPGCATNYHWDPSSVLIVQLSGRKRFHSLKDPLRWCSNETADQGREAMIRLGGLVDEDILTCELGPGDAVWSPCRAPHGSTPMSRRLLSCVNRL